MLPPCVAADANGEAVATPAPAPVALAKGDAGMPPTCAPMAGAAAVPICAKGDAPNGELLLCVCMPPKGDAELTVP